MRIISENLQKSVKYHVTFNTTLAKTKTPIKKSKTQRKPATTSLPSVPSSLHSTWDELDRAMQNFRQDMERAFERPFSFHRPHFPEIPSFPEFPKMPETSCDVIDEGNQLRVKMDVPGVKKNEISLNVTDNSIEMKAGHKESSEEKKKNYLRKERSEVSYYRTLPLPENVVSGKAKAKMTDGVLEVILPKEKPTPKPKKRSISVE